MGWSPSRPFRIYWKRTLSDRPGADQILPSCGAYRPSCGAYRRQSRAVRGRSPWSTIRVPDQCNGMSRQPTAQTCPVPVSICPALPGAVPRRLPMPRKWRLPAPGSARGGCGLEQRPHPTVFRQFQMASMRADVQGIYSGRVRRNAMRAFGKTGMLSGHTLPGAMALSASQTRRNTGDLRFRSTADSFLPLSILF